MDFELTNEQKDVQKAAREFAEGTFPEVIEECDLNETFPKSLWKKACELGFIGVFIDEPYGGAGLGFLDNALIAEEFCRMDGGCGCSIMLTTLGSEFIHLYGREDQKKKYLPGSNQGRGHYGNGDYGARCWERCKLSSDSCQKNWRSLCDKWEQDIYHEW